MPYEPDWRMLSERRSWLIEDLRAHHAVEVECRACSRVTLVAPHALIARYRSTAAVEVVKFRCACGHREVTWRVMKASLPGRMREW